MTFAPSLSSLGKDYDINFPPLTCNNACMDYLELDDLEMNDLEMDDLEKRKLKEFLEENEYEEKASKLVEEELKRIDDNTIGKGQLDATLKILKNPLNPNRFILGYVSQKGVMIEPPAPIVFTNSNGCPIEQTQKPQPCQAYIPPHLMSNQALFPGVSPYVYPDKSSSKIWSQSRSGTGLEYWGNVIPKVPHYPGYCKLTELVFNFFVLFGFTNGVPRKYLLGVLMEIMGDFGYLLENKTIKVFISEENSNIFYMTLPKDSSWFHSKLTSEILKRFADAWQNFKMGKSPKCPNVRTFNTAVLKPHPLALLEF